MLLLNAAFLSGLGECENTKGTDAGPNAPSHVLKRARFSRDLQRFSLIYFFALFFVAPKKKILKLVKMWLICFKFNPVIFFFHC